MSLVSIVIPVYNEEAAIGQVLDDVVATMEAADHSYELLVIDDGSTDGTKELVRGRPQATLIEHPYNRGVGAARTTGVNAAQGEVVVMTDGDGTYPVQDIPRLVAEMDTYDMVIGARTKEAGTAKLLRSAAKHSIRLLASYLSGTKIPDLNSGLRAFRRDLALRYAYVLPSGHSWVSTITLAFLCNGHTVAYLPIDYYRRKGSSTFHPIRDTYNYLVTVLRTTTYFNPLKVFLPLSIFLITSGIIKTALDLILQHRIKDSDVTIIVIGTLVGVLGLLADLIVLQNKKGR
jgi:glycosyltransferase involved in cell wall biosynthesis